MKISYYFRALCSVCAAEKDIKALLSLMIKENVPFGRVSRGGDGYVFSARAKDIPRIGDIAARIGAEVDIKRTGFLALVKKHRRRVGLCAGCAILAASLAVSSRFIWDIRITGNERIATEDIEKRLEGYGLRLGAYKPSLDAGDVCRKMTIGNGGISWISINMRGTVAIVEVRETTDAEKETAAIPSNLVAACDGQIVSVTAYGGKSEVRAGQTVKKGDILVSGVIDSEALGYRLVRARGEVMANVSKRFSASVPLKTTEKKETGAVETYKKIKIFSKTAELFKKTNISFEKYDTIEKTERVEIFGVRLPVFVTTVTYAEYKDVPVELTEEEARLSAAEKAGEMMRLGTAGDRIISVFENVTYDGVVCSVELIVECVTDIATEQIIETERK